MVLLTAYAPTNIFPPLTTGCVCLQTTLALRTHGQCDNITYWWCSTPQKSSNIQYQSVSMECHWVIAACLLGPLFVNYNSYLHRLYGGSRDSYEMFWTGAWYSWVQGLHRLSLSQKPLTEYDVQAHCQHGATLHLSIFEYTRVCLCVQVTLDDTLRVHQPG